MSPSSPSRPLGQSRRASLAEACLNTLAGLFIATLANLYLLPLWGFHPSLAASLEIGLLFTFISILRGYALRRLFNHFHQRVRRS